MRKNEILTMTCTGLGSAFEGVCRHDGQVVFVPGALPGETVEARIIKVAKQYAVGRLESLQSRSDERVEPPCPYFPRCGGCTAQHLAYEATLRHKRQQVVDCLERIGGVTAPEVAETLGMETPWRYRNKGAFPVGGAAGQPVLGIYAARSHDIVDAPGGCLLQTTQSDALVGAVRRWMTEHRVSPYDEATHTGLIRHVMTREAADGTAMLVLVANGARIPDMEALISLAAAAAPGLRGILLSENRRQTNVILGDGMRTLWGEGTLEDTLGGFSFRVSPRSFFQVNRTQAARLYAQALTFAELTSSETVWDLYCGCGTITLPLAAQAGQVFGVEVVQDAVDDAIANAAENGVTNTTFLAGAAENVLPGLATRHGRPDVVVLDPPRKGAEPTALDAIAQAGPARIVYVSCNPATLARDVRRLGAAGYMLGPVQPVDMFGWTGHVESVAVMTRG